MNGRIEARVVGDRVVSLRTAPPLAAKVLTGPMLLLVGSAAGLLEGDTAEIHLSLEAGARLVVRTVAATLAHACPGGGHTALDAHVELGRGAQLAWLPQPLVAFTGCRHRSTTRLDLAAEATAVWTESIALGRHGETAGDVELRLDVELDGRPLLRDGLRAGPSTPSAAGPTVLGGAHHVGSVALLGKRCALDEPAAMQLAGAGTLARALATDANTLEARLAPVRRAFLAQLSPSEELIHVA